MRGVEAGVMAEETGMPGRVTRARALLPQFAWEVLGTVL